MLRVLGLARSIVVGWRGGITAVVASLLLSGVVPNSSFAQVTNLNLGQSVNLSELTNGLSLQVGDKLFSAFTFTKGGDFPDNFGADDLNVVAINDASGNLGIRFLGSIAPIIGGSGDVFITYSVGVTQPGSFISDLHLEYDGTAISAIAEQAFANENPSPVAHLEVSNPPVLNPPTNFFASATLLTPVTQLQIEKDIFVRSGGGATFISKIDQTFSQIPEPSTCALLGFASVALTFWTRQLRRNRSTTSPPSGG